MRKSRSKDVLNILEKQAGHYHRRYRHRSQSISPGSIKKRSNARRLHFLKELENTARCIWNVSEKHSSWHKHADPGLKGGGRKRAKTTLDLERLASIIIRLSISKESQKIILEGRCTKLLCDAHSGQNKSGTIASNMATKQWGHQKPS
jgi:hypothetical protein